jgi:hypothetical protein
LVAVRVEVVAQVEAAELAAAAVLVEAGDSALGVEPVQDLAAALAPPVELAVAVLGQEAGRELELVAGPKHLESG